MRLSRPLVLAVLRTTRLGALAVTSVISVFLLGFPLLAGLRHTLRDLDVSVLYHLSLIVALAGAAFVLDDNAHETLAAMPTGRARVAVVRLTAGFLMLMPVWGIQLLVTPQLIVTEQQIPVLGLAIEGPVLLVCVWAVAACSLRRFDGHGSTVALPAALIGSATLFFLPEPVALFVNPAAPDFPASRIRFAVLGLLGLGVLVQSLRARPPRPRRVGGTVKPTRSGCRKA